MSGLVVIGGWVSEWVGGLGSELWRVSEWVCDYECVSEWVGVWIGWWLVSQSVVQSVFDRCLDVTKISLWLRFNRNAIYRYLDSCSSRCPIFRSIASAALETIDIDLLLLQLSSRFAGSDIALFRFCISSRSFSVEAATTVYKPSTLLWRSSRLRPRTTSIHPLHYASDPSNKILYCWLPSLGRQHSILRNLLPNFLFLSFRSIFLVLRCSTTWCGSGKLLKEDHVSMDDRHFSP